MPDFSLVPVDHQPDFSDVSLVPVDHDPFSADGVTQQVQAQPAQAQPAPIRTPATGATQPDVGAPANNVQAPQSGESWNPESDQPTTLSAAPMLPPNRVAFTPFGELKPATLTPTQQIGSLAADALMGLGMKPYFANDLTSRIGNLLGWTPLGVAGSALDLIDAKHRDDLPGVLAAAAGMIPGAKGVARGVAEEAGAALRGAVPRDVAFATHEGGTLGRGGAAEGRAAAIAEGGLSAKAPTGNFYSVLYETKLKPTSYPGGSRSAHYQEANEGLLKAIEGDGAYARDMENEGVDLRRTPTGLAPRTPPAGFSWHHGDEPGVMQLVSRQQHDPGSIFQDILHPDRRGGFSKWGK